MTINWHELAKEEGLYDGKLAPPVIKRVVPRKDAKGARPSTITWSGDRSIMQTANNAPFRRVPSYPDYYISAKGTVKNLDGHTLRTKVTSSDAQVSLRMGIKNKNIYRHILLHEAWPELAPIDHDGYFTYKGEVWKNLEEFPGYAISLTGVVLRLKNYTVLNNRDGRVYMSKDGKQMSRAIRRLSMETFLHYPGDLKAVEEGVGYAISRSMRVWNLHTMTEVKQIDGVSHTSVQREFLILNVKRLYPKYFGEN